MDYLEAKNAHGAPKLPSLPRRSTSSFSIKRVVLRNQFIEWQARRPTGDRQLPSVANCHVPATPPSNQQRRSVIPHFVWNAKLPLK